MLPVLLRNIVSTFVLASTGNPADSLLIVVSNSA